MEDRLDWSQPGSGREEDGGSGTEFWREWVELQGKGWGMFVLKAVS